MLFSLGGALFGLPPADGHIVPDEGVPEAWLLLFVEGHADSGVYAGVFSASKAGQGWALSTAPKGRLSYDTTVAQPANVWIARLAKDAVMLAIRGALPTHLCVTCDGSPESEAACQVVTDMLSGVCWPLLFTGARQFPRAVTTPIHTTLTTFETSEELSDSLCRLLQRYAPAVTRLRARKLALGDDHSDKQWGVRFLYLTDQWRADLDMYRLDYWDGGSEDEDASEQLVCLPKYPDGLTYIRTDANFTIGSTEGFSAAFLERCAGWQLSMGDIVIRPATTLLPEQQPAALRAAIRQLCELPHRVKPRQFRPWVPFWGQELEGKGKAVYYPVTVRTPGWAWTADMLLAYPQYVEAVRDKDMGLGSQALHVPQLTDELLAAALGAAPHVSRLSAVSLALQSDEHAGAAWPWYSFAVTTADVAQLLKLPDPARQDGPRKVSCEQIIITGDVPQDSVDMLCGRLQHIQWAKLDAHLVASDIVVKLRCPQDHTAQLSTLKTQLRLLQAVRHYDGIKYSDAEKYVTLELTGWPLTHEVMCELQGLPQWASVLDLSQCEWPLEHTEYKALAQHLPASYVGWVLPSGPGSPLVHSIVQGMEQCKERLGPMPIAVLLSGYMGGPVRVGEHVLLMRGSAKNLLRLYSVQEICEGRHLR